MTLFGERAQERARVIYVACAAVGCPRKCDRKMLMCPAHWRLVPKDLQLAVWKHFRPEQLEDLSPSRAYYEAAAAAVEAIARAEGRDETNTFRKLALHMAEQEVRRDAS